MGRIRMHVFINNESDATLRFSHDALDHGEYTPDWGPPATILPGQRAGFEGEGRYTLTPTTGTEGHVWYHVMAPDGSDQGELYIHWDSPLVESQYGNTLHIWAPAGWEVTHSGGQGGNATLEIRLRRTERRNVPDFHAAGRGLAFGNHWDGSLPVMSLGLLWNALCDSLPGPLSELGIDKIVPDDFAIFTRADAGLCGGMVYTVMDYHAAHQLPPRLTSPPTSRDDALFIHCRDRLWDSFDVGGMGHRFLGYSAPSYPNGDEGVVQAVGLTLGRSWVSYREAWPQIQQDIDAGHPSPMGLIQTDDLKIGDNHQVLAYGYSKSGQDVSLFIYDPNEGQEEVVLNFNITQTDGEVHVRRFVNGTEANPHRIFCFFRLNGYAPKAPPLGRRIDSVRDALRACTDVPQRHSVAGAVAAHRSGGSVRGWLATL
jgi:hypothetical protein